MKTSKVIYSVIFLFVCFVMNAQNGTGYAMYFNPPFANGVSLYDIKQYLSNNSVKLNPIEGIYDVNQKSQLTYSSIGPRSSETSFDYAIVKGGNLFYVYAPYNNSYSCQSWLVIEPIGNTGVYNFMFTLPVQGSNKRIISHKQRVILEQGVLWNYCHTLSSEEINAFAGGSNIIEETRCLSGIKTFPDNVSTNGSTNSWTGTGFALRNGYVATNYHVVDNASTIHIRGIKGDLSKTYAAEVMGIDKNNDLALLKISDSSFTGFGNIPYSLTFNIADVGQEVYVLGYPLTSTMGNEVKLTTGVVSAKTGFQGDITVYQISAPIQPGNSGGPLFDSKGNVIGIVNAKHTEAENVGYAIKSMYLKNLIEAVSTSSIIPVNNTISNYSLTNKIKAESPFVFFIECSN